MLQNESSPPLASRVRQAIHAQSEEVVDNLRQSYRLSNEDSMVLTSPHYGSDNQCPICLNEPRNPIETNCGHLFCAAPNMEYKRCSSCIPGLGALTGYYQPAQLSPAYCIILYWRHGNWRGAIRCPVCRQQVSVILRCFRELDATTDAERDERIQMMRDINDYNRRFSGEPRPWLDYVWDLPTLLRHLGSEFFSVGGLMYMFRLRIVLCFVAAVMYLISPLDMIPEAVFGLLGLLDDMFVVLLLAIYVTIIYRRFLAARWQEDVS
ncbi:RNF170 [Cordylochernes scorpioides]|uniref:RNF170 n=1 Tax=Cordylochernes scorpioides TaxID=51811 RepID=A0ABY6KF69_9ARAC|nr:RNF170 [Cordylochernes scorpioides]